MNPRPQSVPTIAQLVDRLFRVNLDPAGREYSLRYVALAAGGHVQHTTIYNLRAGKNTNPTHETIQALALFFGVEPTYFFPELWDRFSPQYRDLWTEYQAAHPELF